MYFSNSIATEVRSYEQQLCPILGILTFWELHRSLKIWVAILGCDYLCSQNHHHHQTKYSIMFEIDFKNPWKLVHIATSIWVCFHISLNFSCPSISNGQDLQTACHGVPNSKWANPPPLSFWLLSHIVHHPWFKNAEGLQLFHCAFYKHANYLLTFSYWFDLRKFKDYYETTLEWYPSIFHAMFS